MTTLMKKAKTSGRDPYMAILEYRNTPIDRTDGYAPAQLLNSSLLKSRLPTSSTLLKPQVVPLMETKLKKRQSVQKHYYDMKRSKPQSTLQNNREQVRFLDPHSRWALGKVTEKHNSPRSYMIETPSGKVYRRNRRHIFQTKEHTVSEWDIMPLPMPNPVSVSTQNESTRINQPVEKTSNTVPQGVKYDTVAVGQATTTRSGRVVQPTQKLDM